MNTCFLPYASGWECMRNLHRARARAAVMGALARGAEVMGRDRRRRGLEINRQKLLQRTLHECCAYLPPTPHQTSLVAFGIAVRRRHMLCSDAQGASGIFSLLYGAGGLPGQWWWWWWWYSCGRGELSD
jgi:hypothetical protein